MFNQIDFGKRVREFRTRKNYTQKEIALRIGVSEHEPAIIRLNQEKPTKSRVCTDSVLFI